MQEVQPLAFGPEAVFSTAPPNLESRAREIIVREATSEPEFAEAVDILVPEYYRRGYVDADDGPTRRRVRRWLKDYKVFIAWCEGIGLATLGVNTKICLPANKMFWPELARFRRKGLRVGEFGRFASRPENRRRRAKATYQLMREVFVRTADVIDVVVIRVAITDVGYYKKAVKFSYIRPQQYWDEEVQESAFGMYKYVKPAIAANDPEQFRGRVRV